MKILFVPTEKVTDELLNLVGEAWRTTPLFHKPTRTQVKVALKYGKSQLYRIVGEDDQTLGAFLISVMFSNGERRMMLEAFHQKGAMWSLRWFQSQLKRMAREMGCGKIETTVFDRRVAEAHLAIGHFQEATVLTLETGYGQQEEDDADN